jgi:hypothetical protein
MLTRRHAVQLFFLTMCCVGFHNFAASQTASHDANMNYSWETYAEASTSNTDSLFGERGVGFRVGVGWKPDPSLELVADFESQPSKNQRFTSVMVGPRFYLSDGRRISGFWQVLGGAYRANFPVEAPRSAAWHYRWGGGLGVDAHITRNLAVRLFEFDITFVGTDVSAVLTPRAATGIAFCFGH